MYFYADGVCIFRVFKKMIEKNMVSRRRGYSVYVCIICILISSIFIVRIVKANDIQCSNCDQIKKDVKKKEGDLDKKFNEYSRKVDELQRLKEIIERVRSRTPSLANRKSIEQLEDEKKILEEEIDALVKEHYALKKELKDLKEKLSNCQQKQQISMVFGNMGNRSCNDKNPCTKYDHCVGNNCVGAFVASCSKL